MMSIKFFSPSTPGGKLAPPGKLARAELWFLDGDLEGLHLTGLAVWADRVVTFPGSTGFRKAGEHGLSFLRGSEVDPVPLQRLTAEILAGFDEWMSARTI